ncbi:nitrate- and nitrite sensing domain-containing protein [Streptomyces sp. NPDC008313]|uniref:sensor histidine kinase n=1 Tax=Streptomyces sp. NPDC008313 TaxID=3364826 RepID=UPI0036E40036
MRAPVQKTRPRRTGKRKTSEGSAEHTPGAAGQETGGKGRPAHVRNRLIVAVAVVAAAVAGAGAPAVVAASGQLGDSQNLVTLAGQTQEALTLAHSLADERDEVTSYIAAGRPKAKAPSAQRGDRVDRQIEELRTDASAGLRENLDDIASVRRAALIGKGGALETHRAYSSAITDLHRLAEDLAEQLPPRAGSGAHALADLDTAVQQAAAARGLLLAALNVPRSEQTVVDPVTGLPSTEKTSSAADAKQRDALSAAAQQAGVRSDAALADFRDSAPKAARASYDSTVTGPEVTTAEKYLAGLTDQPTLSGAELDYGAGKVEAALSARVDLMRGAEASLNDRRTKAVEQLRDDDVTALEIRVAVIGALLLVAVGVAMAMARTLTRPLAVLRLGSARLAADPGTGEPLKFTGRNDEFAQVVRSVNALHAHAAGLQERIATLEADRKHLVGQRQSMAEERERLRTELAEAAGRLKKARGSIHGTFVNLALRTLGLVERQLGVIEGLEEREQDPDRLATLFKLDHFATVMRRHSENLLVLADAEHGQQHGGPVPLVDVVRAAVSEIERYERVRIAALPPHAHVPGFAADDLSHLVAELLENATSFSPPDVPVEVSGWLLENGEVMLSVQDEGIGVPAERMSRLNSLLAGPDAEYDQEDGEGLGLGLFVVARLAHRHGVRVQLREQKQGGIAAVVVLPKALLATTPAVTVPTATPVLGGAPALSLPGADAEANSNVLAGRPGRDPLIAAAEEAMREGGTEGPKERSARDAEPREAARAPDPAAEPDPARPADPATAVTDEPAPDTEPEAAPDTEPDAAPEAASDATDEAAPGTASHATDEPASGPAPEPTADPAPEPASGELDDPAPEPTPETTMELFAPQPPADEAGPAASHAEPAPEPEPQPAPPTLPAPEVRLPVPPAPRDPYAIGPDTHDRAPDEAARESGEEPQRVTDKGLPKRTPKIAAPVPAPRAKAGGVDADALRRRLGGFHRGAKKGRRDVEAEIAEQTAEQATPTGPAQPPAPASGTARTAESTGGPVEEASS